MAGDVILEGRGLTKKFGQIEACVDVDIAVRRGELTAIVGDNGAGKSTLLKMLTGAHQPDAGTITLRGHEVRFGDPREALLQGIATVYQNGAGASNLDAVANIFLGRELTVPILGIPFLRMLDEGKMRRLAGSEIRRLKVDVPQLTGLALGQMSGGQIQAVAIARAAYWTSDILCMDEPTAALGLRESRAVLDLISKILADGVAVVMISHILPHVMELANHTIVMRHGRKVADAERERLTMDDLVKLIVGG